MRRLRRHPAPLLPILALPILLAPAACTGNINTPGPAPSPTPTGTSFTDACPIVPDDPPNVCPRLKNATLTCGGSGMLSTNISGGSGSPILLRATLEDGSVLSAVLVIANCQDGPREGVTFGLTYTGEVVTPSGGPCIRQSKVDYARFQFGNPLYAPFEGLAKNKIHGALDDKAIAAFASRLGLPTPATSRCATWRQMP